jgi:uncharacterized protein YehS (DUF1456 family)
MGRILARVLREVRYVIRLKNEHMVLLVSSRLKKLNREEGRSYIGAACAVSCATELRF